MDEIRGDSLEGFLCPVCIINFNSAMQLRAHYQDQHSEDFFHNVKEMYEKAKKIILFKEQGNATVPETETVATSSSKSTPGYTSSSVYDELGPARSHSEYFKSVRMTRMEHYAAQTNNLLIRLEKLLINLPTDRIKRKVHEQDIVPWLDDKDVKLCPGCAKAFGLLRRKHHCRLCGSVMCAECTFQLTLETARKMTGSSTTSNSVESAQGQHPDPLSKVSTPINKLLRSPSSASVQSVLAMDTSNESFFRLCEHCDTLLTMRQNIKEVRNQKPIINQFYEKLSTSMNETGPLLKKYSKIYNSLCSGETIYNLNDAEVLRVRIIKLAENIDFISNKIAILGQNTEKPPEGNQLKLQRAVRIAATNYLKEHIITLPCLPTEEQLKMVQERRREEIAKRIEEESRYQEEIKPKYNTTQNNAGPATSPRDGEMRVQDGWTPSFPQQEVPNADHPILQQIMIINGFIKQARSENRMDEVITLRKNLQELEDEFRRQMNSNSDES
ncbi:UNVERIFIED_CONTAM: hypothetical protein PYX00_001278 [Menopon gallinae]